MVINKPTLEKFCATIFFLINKPRVLSELVRLTDTSAGALTDHLRVLEAEGMINVTLQLSPDSGRMVRLYTWVGTLNG